MHRILIKAATHAAKSAASKWPPVGSLYSKTWWWEQTQRKEIAPSTVILIKELRFML